MANVIDITTRLITDGKVIKDSSSNRYEISIGAVGRWSEPDGAKGTFEVIENAGRFDCTACALFQNTSGMCRYMACMAIERNDGKSIIFKNFENDENFD